jgi:hypothetical protein
MKHSIDLSDDPPTTYVLYLSPFVASVVAKDGMSVNDVKKYLWENSKIPAREWDHRYKINQDPDWPSNNSACDLVKGPIKGFHHVGNQHPAWYCESNDPNRLLPVFYDWKNLRIIVTGDPNRNRPLLTVSNQNFGAITSKKIVLPPNWDQLMKNIKK